MIAGLLADREFVGDDWFNWLLTEGIPFCIRIKGNVITTNARGLEVGIGVCQQRCRLNFKKIYFNTSSILTRRIRDLSTAIARAIQALLLKQFCAKLQYLC